MKILISVLAILLVSTTAYCKECGGSKKYASDSDYILKTHDSEIKIMSYNLENLFDALHDEGRDDYEFLPINHPAKENCDLKTGYYKKQCLSTDWTDEKVDLKLSQIKKIISVTGSLPDLLAVNEVENVNIVSRLADYLGYEKFLVTSGSDKRIELALLYNEDKIKLREMREVEIKFPEEVNIKKTRNILVANFSSKADPTQILGVYVNHWPSQAAPAGARVIAAQHLKRSIDSHTKKYGENYHAIVMGDFNTIDEDSPHPFKKVFFDENWNNRIYDLDQIYFQQAYKYDPKNMKDKMPPGTYFFDREMSWNRLDRFFVTTNLLDNEGTEVKAQNYRIVAPEFSLAMYENNDRESDKYKSCQYGIPWRYEHNASIASKAGFSDHFPLVVTLEFK